ncbi:MAG: PAS domain S-box protein [Halobacteria archaeon]
MEETKVETKPEHLSAQEVIEAVSGTPLILFYINTDGVFELSVGEGLGELGLERNEVVGKSVYDLFGGNHDIIGNVEETWEGKIREYGTRENGRIYENYLYPVENPDADGYDCLGISLDVTQKKETESRVRSLVENIPGMAIQFTYKGSGDGTIEYVSKGCEELTGYTKNELTGGAVDWSDDIVYPEDRDKATEKIEKTVEEGSVYENQYRIRKKSGETRWIRVRGDIESIGDSCICIDGIVIDVTERVEKEADVRKQATAMDAATQGIAILNDEEEYVYVNQAHADLYGYEREELNGETWRRLYDDDELERFEEEIMPQLYEDGNWTGRATGKRKDGSNFEQRVSLAGLEDGGLVCVVNDVTEIVERKRELEKSERRFEAVFNDPNLLMGILDTDGTLLHANRTALEIIGAERDDVEGQHFPDTPWWGHSDRQRKALEKDIERAKEGEYVEFEAEHLEFQGGEVIVEGAIRPVRNGDGEVVSLIVSGRDITLRKEHERELIKRTAAIEASADGICIYEEGEGMIYVNEALTDMFEYEKEELLGETWEVFYPEDQRGEIPDSMEIGDRWTGEGLGLKKDGSRLPVELVLTKTDVGIWTGIARDITERKKREEELETYEELVESANDSMFALKNNLEFGLVNDSFMELTGYSSSQLVGEGVSKLWEDGVFTEEGYLVFIEGLQSLKYGDIEDFNVEMELHNAEGNTIQTEFNVSTISGGIGYVGVIRDVTDYVHQREMIEEQRDELVKLNSINKTIRGINRRLVSATDPDEIKKAVCTQLVESGPYVFAWIGDVKVDTLVPEFSYGSGGEYLEGLEIPINHSGPGPESVRSGEAQVSNDILNDDSFKVEKDGEIKHWGEKAKKMGFRSAVSVPIAFRGIPYGCIAVYSGEKDHFDVMEVEVLEELGKITGHAINSVERKQALFGETVKILGFVLPDISENIEAGTDLAKGTISINSIVGSSDGYTLYVDVEDITNQEVKSFVDESLGANEAEELSNVEGTRKLEIKGVESEILDLVHEWGGIVTEMEFRSGDLLLSAELNLDTDVASLLEELRTFNPDTRLVSQRTRERSSLESGKITSDVLEELTEKQREVLETSYHSGFFDFPRKSTGEDVANVIDVNPSTFHQHLRKGQKKVMEEIFDSK